MWSANDSWHDQWYQNDFIQVVYLIENYKAALQDHDMEKANTLMVQNKEILTLLKKEFVSIPINIKNFADIFTLLQVNIDYLKHLIASDWYGNWHAYIQSVKKLFPFYAECDSINYLCLGSWYLEFMNRLSTERPNIHKEFTPGHFAVKTNSEIWAHSTKIPKSSSWIIEKIRQIDFVPDWEVIYNEILAISNPFQNLTRLK